ncbi:hypothetical protein [Endozoicomonas sp. SCSIO W0465]|uniref:lipase family protein n=1 Tax=Endozoicomonas sp. SCSIO W0465 TaxID=2918516 RepID=UPI002074B6E0|nr:hypothetical protein [Endozoicomonas sp. SCSIO W0465]USE34206.1 hypothetical protein MJO57_18790 [Endozoicomonas sp. SCSIO W0465]
MLNSEKPDAGKGIFEQKFENNFINNLRKKGLIGVKGADALSKTQFNKQVKQAIKLNASLIKQRGQTVTNGDKSKDIKQVEKAPHTNIQQSDDFSKMAANEQKNIQSHIMLGAAAYKGFQEADKIPPDCSLLTRDELPVELQMLYDDKTGLIHTADNAKALIVRKGDEIVLSFAGTEPGSQQVTGRSGTIKTDLTQWLGMESPMYQSAAAIFDLLLSHEPLSDAKFSVAGHSLGGGLAQFAYTAVQGKHNPDRLAGAITINPAGLSQSTLNKLGDDRVNMAKDNIQNVRIEGDPVSPSGNRKAGLILKGNLIGSIMTLPDPKGRGMGVRILVNLNTYSVSFEHPELLTHCPV